MFSGGQEACTLYDEIDYPENSLGPLDLMQEFDGVPTRQLQDDVEKAGSSFQDNSFSRLLNHDTRLRELRRRFAERSPDERRMAADFEYHSTLAEQLINEAREKDTPQDSLPGEVVALAIDPGLCTRPFNRGHP